jgi:hypothetical protein
MYTVKYDNKDQQGFIYTIEPPFNSINIIVPLMYVLKSFIHTMSDKIMFWSNKQTVCEAIIQLKYWSNVDVNVRIEWM